MLLLVYLAQWWCANCTNNILSIISIFLKVNNLMILLKKIKGKYFLNFSTFYNCVAQTYFLKKIKYAEYIPNFWFYLDLWFPCSFHLLSVCIIATLSLRIWPSIKITASHVWVPRMDTGSAPSSAFLLMQSLRSGNGSSHPREKSSLSSASQLQSRDRSSGKHLELNKWMGALSLTLFFSHSDTQLLCTNWINKSYNLCITFSTNLKWKIQLGYVDLWTNTIQCWPSRSTENSGRG